MNPEAFILSIHSRLLAIVYTVVHSSSATVVHSSKLFVQRSHNPEATS